MRSSAVDGSATRATASRSALRQRWRSEGWYPALSLGQACEAAARAAPDARLTFAGRDREVSIGRAELHRRSRRAAAGLLAAGLTPGQPVVVQAPATVDSTVAVEALWLVGAVVIPVVAASGETDTRQVVELSGATTLVVPADPSAGSLVALAHGLGVPLIVVVDGDSDDDRDADFGDDRDATESGESGDADRADERILPLARLEAHEPLAALPAVDPASTACVIYTSGSTAAPKGVRHSHETLLAGYRPPGVDEVGPSLMTFPAGHIASVLGLVRPLTAGGTTIVMDRWSPRRAVELIEGHRVLASAGTPFYLGSLLDEAERSGRDIGSLRLFLVGAASVPPALVERAEGAGIVTWRTYGSTEHPAVSTGVPTDPVVRRIETDGRPGPGNEVRIIDDDGRDVPAGADGEVLARGPRQFLGYDDPTLDEAAFTDDGWFRTGDVGRLDEEGYLTITDRKKDIVIRGGENVSAKEVEDALATHPSVAEVAVCAGPDPVWGERVCAFVRARPGAAPTLDDLRAHVVASGLAPHKAPEQLEVVEDLPRTATGKVRKVVLRNLLRASSPT